MSNFWTLKFNTVDREMIEIWHEYAGMGKTYKNLVAVFHIDCLPDSVREEFLSDGEYVQFAYYDVDEIKVRLEVLND